MGTHAEPTPRAVQILHELGLPHASLEPVVSHSSAVWRYLSASSRFLSGVF